MVQEAIKDAKKVAMYEEIANRWAAVFPEGDYSLEDMMCIFTRTMKKLERTEDGKTRS